MPGYSDKKRLFDTGQRAAKNGMLKLQRNLLGSFTSAAR